MPSSADGAGWGGFRPRVVPGDVDLTSPAAEMAAALQQCGAAVDAVRRAGETAREAAVRTLAEQAVLAVELESILARYEALLEGAGLAKVHRHVLIHAGRILDSLAQGGIEVVRLKGRPYDDVATLAEIDGWLHRKELDGEFVLDEIEPAVRHRGEVVRLGRVVMGAPDPAEDEVRSTSKERS